MLRNTLVLVLVIVAAQCATILHRTIPVEVRYERLNYNRNANLAEQVQLSSKEIIENRLKTEKLVEADEVGSHFTLDHSTLIKNLDEKVQLSPDDLIQAPKHIPVPNTLDELRSEITDPGTLRNKNLISTIQEYVENRLHDLRKNFIPKDNENAPPKELWEGFEKDVRKYFEEEKMKNGLRQDQGANQENIFQNFMNGLQQFGNNLVVQLQGQNTSPPSGTAGDEGTPPNQNPVQGFIGYFIGGFQDIISNVQNFGQVTPGNGNTTVLGDSESSNQRPGNIFTSFVSGVQQIFQAPQQGITQVLSGNNTQSDTGSPTSPGGNPIQQVIQSFGTIGNAINSFVQGGGQPNKPQGSEDENSSKPPNQNIFQSIGQNFGNALQNLQNQIIPPSGGQLPAIPTSTGTNNNSNSIIEQVSSIGNQIQQAAGQAVSNSSIQNLIPGLSTTSSTESPNESSGQKNIEEEQKPNEEPIKEIEKPTETTEEITAIA